jgi:hypothetical protein
MFLMLDACSRAFSSLMASPSTTSTRLANWPLNLMKTLVLAQQII